MQGRIVFEALPGPARDPPDMQAAHIDALRPLRGLGVDAIVVPEIKNGHYTTVSPHDFAVALKEATGLPVSVACVTVHREARAFEAWVQDTEAAGLGALLVGGESSSVDYPGIGVEAALRQVDGRVPCSVVTIPSRRRSDRDEPERLLAKQQAGATQAISQILYEPDAALRLQEDLAAAAQAHGVRPLPLLWSLAPVVRKSDIAFLEWLGVEVPAATKQALSDAGTAARREALSLDVCQAIARRLVAAGATGFCIEHVKQRNVEAAFRLVERVRAEIQERGGAVRPAISLG